MSNLHQTREVVQRIIWARMRERLANAYGPGLDKYVSDLRHELGEDAAYRELRELCILAETIPFDAVSSM